MGGQRPYTPFENDRLKWKGSVQGDYVSGRESKFRVPKDKLGVVLLIGSADSKDCCAVNYERTLFRNEKVVKFAKEHAVSYRLDRGGYLGSQFYKKFSLSKKKPALLVLDHHGDLLYKLQLCENPKTVAKEFKSAQLLTRKREAAAGKNAKKVRAIKKLVKAKKYPQALTSMSRLKPKALTLPLRKRLKAQQRAVFSLAKKKLRVARKLVKKKQYDRAISLYQGVAKQFGRLKSVKKKARAGLERARKRKAKFLNGEKVSTRAPETPVPAGAY